MINRIREWLHRLDTIPLRHLGDEEDIVICARQHPAVLVPKVIRTGSGTDVSLIVKR